MKKFTSGLISSVFVISVAFAANAAQTAPAAQPMSMDDAEKMAKEIMNSKEVQDAISKEKGKIDDKGMDNAEPKGKMKEQIPDNVKAELKAYHEKKKALREALSPEAKAVLDRRRDKMKHKRMEGKDEMMGDKKMMKEKMMNKSESTAPKN